MNPTQKHTPTHDTTVMGRCTDTFTICVTANPLETKLMGFLSLDIRSRLGKNRKLGSIHAVTQLSLFSQRKASESPTAHLSVSPHVV